MAGSPRGWAGRSPPLTPRPTHFASNIRSERGRTPLWSLVGRIGIFVFHAIAVSINNDPLPVIHQPVDQGRGQGVVHVEEFAPFPERSIRGDHDRSHFITGGDNLEQQIGPTLVDGQIAQLIEQEKTGTDITSERFAERPMELGRGEMIDHVHDTRMANRMATLNRRVTQCRQQMGLSRSGGPNQNGTAVLLDEIAVEEPQDRCLGDSLGELEVVFSQGLWFGKPRLPQPPLKSALLTGGLLNPDQDRQNFQEGGPFASGFVENLAVALGDLQELQFGQVTVEPCLEIVITPCHQSPRRWCYRNGRKRRDQQVANRSRRSIRAVWESAAWVWEAAGAGVPPAEGSRRRPRHRPPAPGRGRWPRPPRPSRRPAPDPAGGADGHPSSPAGVSGRGGTGAPRGRGHQTPVRARNSATAGSDSAPRCGVPAARSVAVAGSSVSAGQRSGPGVRCRLPDRRRES